MPLIRVASAILTVFALLLVVPATSAQASPDLMRDLGRCLDSLDGHWVFCSLTLYNCTSTSRCTGAGFYSNGKTSFCFNIVGCTPWIPTCWYAEVYVADEDYHPTFAEGECLLPATQPPVRLVLHQ